MEFKRCHILLIDIQQNMIKAKPHSFSFLWAEFWVYVEKSFDWKDNPSKFQSKYVQFPVRHSFTFCNVIPSSLFELTFSLNLWVRELHEAKGNLFYYSKSIESLIVSLSTEHI